jgi:chromosomal replication initiator protein
MPHATSLDIAQEPGQSYNPLFIYGGVGLGKTHLMQAIGHLARANNHNVLYVSSEQFTNDFITAVRDKQTDAFRKKYRSINLLLIDDIHFIAGKAGTEECFFHIFNELHNAGRQIVLTSNCPPKAMTQISDRLRSRFEWGLSVEIKPPSLKTRLDILTAKAERANVKIPPKVLECIAQSVKGSVRELEGGLNRVAAYARLTRLEISPETARQALADIADQTPPADNKLQPGSVVRVVAEGFNLSPGDITGRKRDKETALARQVAAYLLKQQNNCSLAEIGLQLGGRSPSTVSHALEKVTKDIENSPYLERKIKGIRKKIDRL